jgi:hypothetical protein
MTLKKRWYIYLGIGGIASKSDANTTRTVGIIE